MSSLNEQQITARVFTAIENSFPVRIEDITVDSDLQEVLHGDDLTPRELAFTIEDEFNITIPEEALGSLRTVSQIVQFILDNQP
jgi:acyl carrier protein